jgi:threonine dehydrogenase-like Zn-dependent dehydrogenase
VPDGVSLRHAALACCALGPGFTAVERTRAGALDTVLVSGCGPVGLGAILNAAARGARSLALELNPYRANLARRLGAEIVLEPTAPDTVDRVRDLTGGRGADCAVETSGAPDAASLLVRATRPRGRIALVAWGHDLTLPPPVPYGQELHGCWHWNHQRHAEAMWTTVRRAGTALDVLVTHEFPLGEVTAAMDLQDTGRCGKVFLLPFGAEALS